MKTPNYCAKMSTRNLWIWWLLYFETSWGNVRLAHQVALKFVVSLCLSLIHDFVRLQFHGGNNFLIWSLLKSTPVYFSRSHNYLSNPINCMIESMAKCWCWILFQLVIHLSIQSMAKFCHNPWLNSAIKKKGPFCLPTPRIHSINKGTKVLAEKTNTKKKRKKRLLHH